jgi:TonB family protein
MSTTQIPPAPPSQPADGSDLYEAQGWESAYLETHDVPALLIQLQDDLSRSRQREALWISVVVHLTIVILLVNSQRLERIFPRRGVIVVSPNDLMREKDLTYLELPPDEQKLTKRPNTNSISDKDRIATSRAPQIDREELRKILQSARPGAPGPSGPPAQSQQPAAPAPAMAQNTPAPQPQAPPPAPLTPNQNPTARLQAPPAAPKPTFTNNGMTPGEAIEQAARAAIANRGGYAGDNGDYGLSHGKPTASMGSLDVLSDTMGVDFGPYLARILHDIKQNWIVAIPESAVFKKGKTSIQFAILKDGSVRAMQLFSSSGDAPLDRAAWAGITGSNPFPPLPNEFAGPYLELRIRFCYNLDRCDPE